MQDESESRLIMVGDGLVISNSFTGIELMYSSRRGHAVLYRAQRMGKWHVLKCLKPEYAGNPLYRGLLHKEFEIGYGLSHPNIVQVTGLEHVDGLGVCIVMEYVDGRTLRSALEAGGMTAGSAMRILSQVCSALAYIHGKQVIHRDLKPENIMITGNGDNVKLIDFGYSDADSYAVLKQPAGTRRYAAPEQMDGKAVDARADLYALGVIMREINAALPHKSLRLSRIARRCTQPMPQRRYASAAAVSHALSMRYTGITVASAVLVAVIMAFVASVVWRGDVSRAVDETMAAGKAVPDTVVVLSHDTVRVDAPAPPDSVARRTVLAENVITDLNTDERLAALNRFARENTLRILVEADRVMKCDTTSDMTRYIIFNNMFSRAEDAVKKEVRRLIDPNLPEFSIYQSAALSTMQQTVVEYNKKKYHYN